MRSQLYHEQLDKKIERETDRFQLPTPRNGVPNTELTIIPPIKKWAFSFVSSVSI